MTKGISSAFRPYGSSQIDPVLVVLWVVLIGFAVVWMGPTVFIIFTSLKSQATITQAGAFSLPTEWLFQNYVDAWERGRFGTTLINSTVITFVKVPLGLFVSAMAAYALSRISIPGGRVVLLLIIFGAMIPFQVLLAPLFTLIRGFGLINTYFGVFLPYVAFGLPYQVFILHGFFKEVPNELSEAALIDGASHFTIFWRVFLPISLPVLAALLIFDFVSTWNEFAMALVLLLDSDMWTLPLGLMVFQGEFATEYGPLNAAIIMTVLPAVIVYLIFQRYFVSGLTSGAVKG